MSGCNELLEVVVTLTGPPIWENSRMGAERDPAQDRDVHRPFTPRAGGPGEHGCVGSRGSSSVEVENPVPSFSGMSTHVEQQSNPSHENVASPPDPGGRDNPVKNFVSAAAGAFIGRVLGDFVSKVAQKLLPWLIG